ncbi:MAG: GNAT family N-acetyltransferase [Paracoccus sp. (in: a-proteobacteria)]
MTQDIRLSPAHPEDAPAMAAVQNAIFQAGLRRVPVDAALMRERYLARPGRIVCTLAGRGGEVLGFQALSLALPDNEYGVSPGRGVIGTHIRPDAGRAGIGRQLFAETRQAALAAGLVHIDAMIGADNLPGLAYYRAMGFVPYREGTDTISHRYDL